MEIAPIDIALLLVALAACGYCFLLNRRLRALHDTRKGVGATIMALSETIAKMNMVTDASNQQARASAEALDAKMQEAKLLCTKLERLVSQSERTFEGFARHIEAAERSSDFGAMLFDDPKNRHAGPDIGNPRSASPRPGAAQPASLRYGALDDE